MADSLIGADIPVYPARQDDISTEERLRCYAGNKRFGYSDVFIDDLRIGEIRPNPFDEGDLVFLGECDDRILSAWMIDGYFEGWWISHADSYQI